MALAAACDPLPPPPVLPPFPLLSAACLPARPSEEFVMNLLDTRTGCAAVTKTLGSVQGTFDLVLPVALVRSEGNPPPTTHGRLKEETNVSWGLGTRGVARSTAVPIAGLIFGREIDLPVEPEHLGTVLNAWLNSDLWAAGPGRKDLHA